MRKNLILLTVSILILSSLFCGCTQQNPNNGDVYKEVEITSQNITTTNSFREVIGTVKNIGNRTINVTVLVTFYNKNNDALFTGPYTIYNFVSGVTENFFVDFWATEPNYNEYDHYALALEYALE